MRGASKEAKAVASKPAKAIVKDSSPSPSPTANLPETQQAENTASQVGFPIKTQDQGVTLEARSLRESGGFLLLAVQLQNQGNRAVQFRYDNLKVVDERGRMLSATVDGLPGRLPAQSRVFVGTVKVPLALVDTAEELSVILTDQPNQQLQLVLTNIPVLKQQ